MVTLNYPSKNIKQAASYMNLELKRIAKMNCSIKFYYIMDIKTKLEIFNYNVGQDKGIETSIDGNLGRKGCQSWFQWRASKIDKSYMRGF